MIEGYIYCFAQNKHLLTNLSCYISMGCETQRDCFPIIEWILFLQYTATDTNSACVLLTLTIFCTFGGFGSQ